MLAAFATRQGLYRRIRGPGAPTHQIPDPNGLIIPRRGEVPAIRAEDHAADPFVVSAESNKFLARLAFERCGILDQDGAVCTRRYQPIAVAAERHAADAAAMPAQGKNLL